jgi:outer membrane protein assembly factor BamB
MAAFKTILSVVILVLAGADGLSQYPGTSGEGPDIQVINGTFLGNARRNFYGNRAPSSLNVLWKHYLGKGTTVISRRSGSRVWAGAGWTGQPLLVREGEELFLVQGAYDHHLKKINAASGELVWQYRFDDVVKGTGTLWHNPGAGDVADSWIILQGSRLGTGHFLDAPHVPSYRAISYMEGEELWRLDVKLTNSYSRDVDASALVINDTAYIGLENSLFTVFDPDPGKAALKDGMLQPLIYQETRLYHMEDVSAHRNNVVTEASPCLLDDVIYIASGSGHIWGYSLHSRSLVWDFATGSDMDGSTVVTSDGCILASIEKQYIPGRGGAIKLDPSRDPADAVVWYFPTGDKEYGSWQGGLIGSIGISDSYNEEIRQFLAAFTGIDGYLYVVDHSRIDTSRTVIGPDAVTEYHPPVLVFKDYVGPSISTPIFTGDRLVVAGYGGIRLYGYDSRHTFTLLDEFEASFESTPVCHEGRIFIASRNGYLYCFGD